MLEGRFRQDAMTEIEDMRAGLESLEDALDVLVESGSAGDQRQRVEIALQGVAFGQRRDGDLGSTPVSRQIASISAMRANFLSCVPAPRGKAMIRA